MPETSGRTASQPNEGALAEQNVELFKILVSQVRDYAIFMLDATGHIVTWNDGAERIKGYTAADIIGRHFSVFYPEAEIRSGKPEWELVVAAEEGRFEDEGWRLRKDGSRFWADVVITALRAEDGSLRGFTKVTRDLTARRRQEQDRHDQLRREADLIRQHANRMAELERVKSEFLNLVSHELRGPLTVLRGYVSMFEDGSLAPDRLREFTPLMAGKLQQMELLVQQMLETARLESNSMQLKPVRFDLAAVVAGVVEGYRALADRHQLTFTTDGADYTVVADRPRVETVVTNLVDNAVKYSPNGGGIEVSLARTSHRIFVNVRDRGIGIARDDLGRLFQRFSRPVDERLAISGTGLGLYLSREIARRHGGDILVQSELHEGSCFTLALPWTSRLPAA